MANSRNKGNRGQRDFAKQVLEPWSKKEFASTPASGGLRWGAMKNVIGDIVCTTEGHFFPFSVEVKFYIEINFEHTLYLDKGDLIDFWKQAVSDSERAKKIALLAMRYNRLPKGFFFLGMGIKEFKKIILPHLEPGSKIMYITHLNLAIFSTTLLLTTPYKKIRKVAKEYIKTNY